MDAAGAALSAIALLASLQLWVSIHVARSSLYERRQKQLQIALIWPLPVIGAVIVCSMMKTDGRSPYKPEKGYTEPGDSAS
jgi:hypothetical protein